MSWLCCFSRASLSLFSSCKSSDLGLRSCSSLSRRKPTTSELHLLVCFYPQCPFQLAPYVFLSPQITPNLSIFRSLFPEPAFSPNTRKYGPEKTPYLDTFHVMHFLQIFLLGPQKVAHFHKSSSPTRPVPLTFHLFFDLHLFMRVTKLSLRLRTVTANSSQLLKLSAILCHMAPLSLLPDLLSNIPLLAINLIIWMSFSLIHDMIDQEGGKQKISLQVV